MMNVTVQTLLQIIGEKDVQIILLRQQLAAADERAKEQDKTARALASELTKDEK